MPRTFVPLLVKFWYGDNGGLFYTWGRRDQTYIPFARTTMFVEGHWSSLKRNYLIYHNRPRLDFLLYIIDVKMLPRFYGLHDMIRVGKINPSWYKSLLSEWDKKRSRDFIGAVYFTDFKRWTCNCASF